MMPHAKPEYLAVGCPFCGANPGEPCHVTPNRTNYPSLKNCYDKFGRPTVHKRRVEAADTQRKKTP